MSLSSIQIGFYIFLKMLCAKYSSLTKTSRVNVALENSPWFWRTLSQKKRFLKNEKVCEMFLFSIHI